MLEVDNTQLIENTLNYVSEEPVKASLEAKFRPEFTFNENNARDVTLRLAMQLCLMGHDQDVSRLINNSGNRLDTLFTIFAEMAQGEKTDAEKKELQKLKKIIHAFARLNNHALAENKKKRIVNVEKLLRRNEENKATLKRQEVLLSEVSDRKKIAIEEIQRLKSLSEQDDAALQSYIQIENGKHIVKQTFAVVENITPITDPKKREQRKTIKSRINKFSFIVSLIVGIGEGLITAIFAAGAWPFLVALLAVGIPAGLCNYFLFRGDSFSVMKQIWFGQSTDTPRKKIMKSVSTLFSGAAGISYGFLSFGSALIAFGHLFFGLTAVAAMAAPPVALIVLAAAVAVVTAIALTTLYDHMIRQWIDKGTFTEQLKKIKNDVMNFFTYQPENGKNWNDLKLPKKLIFIAKKGLDAVIHTVFCGLAIAASVIVVVLTTALFKHTAATIIHNTFRASFALASKISTGITVGMGALVNSAFYVESAVASVNMLKKAAFAIRHPIKTAKQLRKIVTEFFNQKTHRIVAGVVNGFKRLFLFGTVTMNSVVGQGCGAGREIAIQRPISELLNTSLPIADCIAATTLSLGSGGANAAAVVSATKIETVVATSTISSYSSKQTPRSSRSSSFFKKTQEETPPPSRRNSTAFFQASNNNTEKPRTPSISPNTSKTQIASA